MVVRDTDVIVVGAGAAGLSLVYRLCTPPPGRPVPEVTLVDAPAGPLRPPERTWCFWEASPGDFDGALSASWESLRVRGRDGTASVGRPAPFRYKMLRSGAFEELLAGRLAGPGAPRRVTARIDAVHDTASGAEVTGVAADGSALTLRGRWVFDSRPPRVLPPARTTLLQHFRGWFVRTERPVFDPRTADLMDFRTPRPPHGLSFGYVLPTSTHEALVEYTEFSREVLDDAGYDRALRHYTEHVLGLGPFEVTATERGVIPMTDGRFPRRAGRSVFRIGTAGGATRPSTGYTFAAAQRQARAVAAAYHAGRVRGPGRWTRSCCAGWTAGESTGPRSSRGCSVGYRCRACSVSWTATPARTRTSRSACARRSVRCCAPSPNCRGCRDGGRPTDESDHTEERRLSDDAPP